MVRIFIALILVLSPVSVVHSEVSKMLEPDHHLSQAGTMDASMLFISPDKPSNIQKTTTIAEPAAKATKAGLEITPEIVELARGLRNDPQLIYEFVRNNIDYNPTFGLTKGATMTYLDGEGNDFDQTTLLIALMTAAGYTASYMYGEIRLTGAQVMNWLGIPDDPNLAFNIFYYGGKDQIYVSSSGGSIDYVEIEHAWAKVTIDGTDYMFDPSFKEYTYKQGVDLDAALGYVKSTFIARATDGMTSMSNYLEDMNRTNIRSDLTTYTSNLVAYIETNIPGAGIDDVIGGRRIKIVRNQPFQTTLDYVKEVQEWMPDETMVYFSYYNNLYPAEGNFDVELEAREIYGKRLTLHTTFDGTDYYVHLILEGEEIAVGKYTEDNQFSIWIDHASLTNEGTYGDQYGRINLDKDAFYCFVNGWGHTGRKIIEKRRMILEQFLADGLAPDSEEVLGESLNLIGLSWLSETSSVNKISDSVSNAISIRHHDFGWLTQKDTIIFDTPMSASSSLPLDGSTWPPPGSFFAKSGLKSAFEWGAIDQMQPISAVSTIKLLDIANMQGDKIFDATSSNYYSDVRPNLVNYTAEQLNTLDNYISQYYRLILPEHGDLQDKNFRGPGFFALYYDESMKTLIMGGLNGGYGTEYGECDPDSAAKGQKDHDNPEDHPKSAEPIDLLTGHYLETSIDLSTGGRQLPFGLEFIRTYNSGSRLQDGPLGLGRDHNWNVKARKVSNGFVGLGARSVVDAAPAIAEIYIAADILQDGLLLDRLMISTLAHRWLVDNLIDNVVNISANRVTHQFVKLPDGTYNPPPGKFAQLNLEADDSFLLVEKHGEQLDFDTEGRLASWQDLNGNLVTLNYIGDKLSTITNNMGRTLTISYDVNNRLSAVSDGTGRSVSYIYDSAGNLITAIDPELNQTKYGYDIDGRLTRIFKPSDPVNPSVINSYDFLDRVTTQLDSAGNPYTYYYAGTRTEEVDPAGNSRIWEFDGGERTVRFTDPMGFSTDFDYDGIGRLAKINLPEGNGSQYVYDARDNITQVHSLPKTGSTAAPLVSSLDYDPGFNRVCRITDSLGRLTDFTYDTKGNLTRLELPEIDGIRPTFDYTVNTRGQISVIDGPEGLRWEASFDSITGEMLSGILDPAGLQITTALSYDPAGNITQLTDPRGHAFSVEYNDNRQPVKIVAPAPLAYETLFEYDPDGNMTRIRKETGDAGNPWQDFAAVYNLGGQQTAAINPLGHHTVFEYNNLQALWKITSSTGQVDEFLYDPLGRPYKRIDPLGHVVEEYAYTDNGKLASVVDANGNPTTYRYDDFDRFWKEIFADGTYREFSYDLAGNITQERTRAGDTVSYGYDSLNRRISKTLPGPELTHYDFDALSRLIRVTDDDGVITLNYDNAGRIESIAYPGGRTLHYAYDANGNKTGLTYPDGYELTYSYDVVNRMTEIRENGGDILAQYTYDPLSRITNLVFGNSVATDHTYLLDNSTGSTRYNFTNGVVDFEYSYNDLGLLTAKEVSDNDFLYTPSQPSTAAYTANSLNQYSSVSSQSYTYDNNGNLTYDGLNTYQFNPENKLMSVTTPQHTVAYSYNAIGQRVGKDVDGTAARFVHDGLHMLAEFDAGGTMTKRFIHGPGLDSLVMMQTAAGSYYYHQDRLRSVIALSDAAGNRVETYAYSPHGDPSRLSAVGNPFMFTGREYEPETGLSYMRARYFSAGLGRFVSVDPLGVMGGDLNLYAYVRNSPLNYLDPLGLCGATEKSKPSIITNIADTVVDENLMNIATPRTDFERTLSYLGKISKAGFSISPMVLDKIEAMVEEMTPGELWALDKRFERLLRGVHLFKDKSGKLISSVSKAINTSNAGASSSATAAESGGVVTESSTIGKAVYNEVGANINVVDSGGISSVTASEAGQGVDGILYIVPVLIPTEVLETYVDYMLNGGTPGGPGVL